MNGQATPQELAASGALRMEGDAQALRQLMGMLDKPVRDFPIMTR